MNIDDTDAQLKVTDTTLDETFDAMAHAVQTTAMPAAILSLAAQLQAKLDARRGERAIGLSMDDIQHS